jgi:hypothetical protein
MAEPSCTNVVVVVVFAAAVFVVVDVESSL